MFESQYAKALLWALGLHVLLIIMLSIEPHTRQATVAMEVEEKVAIAQPEIVKAYSLDSAAVADTVNQLKEERLQEQKAAAAKQQAMDKRLAIAKQERIKEQKQLAKLKEEADTLAIARKKQAEEEKKHLKELAQQQALEAKHIKALQEQKEQLLKQQAEEAKKLEQINKQKAAAKAEAAKEKKEKALKKAAKLASDRKAKEAATASAAAAAAAEADKKARMVTQAQARVAGEVDRYKALIVDAIGRHWIIPENADTSLSSRFSIRLAPNGMVLQVTLLRSSGDPILDRSAQTAIYKASPLPVPTDAETFNLFREISLTVRPEQIRG